jgi:S1-C subfamily serine protease
MRDFKLPIFLYFFLFILLAPECFCLEVSPVSQIYQKNMDSVVLVGGLTKKKRDNTSGSGFIIKNNGLIITNWHVIKNATKILVKFDHSKKVYEAQLIKSDELRDLALIKIKAADFVPVILNATSKVSVGDRVVTIGNPMGLENTVSDGLVSSIRKVQKDFYVYQISVPLSAGSSGGPLFNMQGEVIGVTTATLLGGQALNFAVPSKYIANFLKPRIDTSKENKGKERTLSDSIQSYVVSNNETLYSIARKFKTDILTLQKLNKLKDNKIRGGQILMVPRE